MPEYMTKSEPVDKKPYIVYTDEKGILYSGDPDSDIPGSGNIDLGNAVMVTAYEKSGNVNTQIEYFANAYIDATRAVFVNASDSASYAGFAGNMDIELFIENENVVVGTETITAVITEDGTSTAFTDFETEFVEEEPFWKITFKMPNTTADESGIAFYFESAK